MAGRQAGGGQGQAAPARCTVAPGGVGWGRTPRLGCRRAGRAGSPRSAAPSRPGCGHWARRSAGWAGAAGQASLLLHPLNTRAPQAYVGGRWSSICPANPSPFEKPLTRWGNRRVEGVGQGRQVCPPPLHEPAQGACSRCAPPPGSGGPVRRRPPAPAAGVQVHPLLHPAGGGALRRNPRRRGRGLPTARRPPRPARRLRRCPRRQEQLAV